MTHMTNTFHLLIVAWQILRYPVDIIHFHFPSSLRRTEISLIVPQQHQLLRISSQTKLQVATCKGLGVFWKLLFRWKGSIYKLVSGGGRRRRSKLCFPGLAKSSSLPHRLLHSLPHLSPHPEWRWTGTLGKWNSGFFCKYRNSIDVRVCMRLWMLRLLSVPEGQISSKLCAAMEI